MPPGWHSGDLRPPDRRWMPAGHQIEGRVRERQRRLAGVGHDDHATRVQQAGGLRDVRRPRLRRDRGDREGLCLGEHLATAGLDVKRSRRATESTSELTGVAPGRTLLGGPPFQPGEIPSGHVRRRSGLDERIERVRHTHQSLRGRNPYSRQGGRCRAAVVQSLPLTAT